MASNLYRKHTFEDKWRRKLATKRTCANYAKFIKPKNSRKFRKILKKENTDE